MSDKKITLLTTRVSVTVSILMGCTYALFAAILSTWVVAEAKTTLLTNPAILVTKRPLSPVGPAAIDGGDAATCND